MARKATAPRRRDQRPKQKKYRRCGYIMNCQNLVTKEQGWRCTWCSLTMSA
jgi:hypothetical protein